MSRLWNDYMLVIGQTTRALREATCRAIDLFTEPGSTVARRLTAGLISLARLPYQLRFRASEHGHPHERGRVPAVG